MKQQSLQQKIDAHGDVFDMMYNARGRPFGFPLQPEFSNWQDEQRAWRHAAIFQDMSYHMCDVTFAGPDLYPLLSYLGINSFTGFGAMQAKQYVVCNPDGHYIGDAILFCEEENRVSIVGKPAVANWVAFHAETGRYDVRLEHFDPPSPDLAARRRFRFQVQGPNADRIFEIVNGGPLPEIGFFKMGKFRVGPHEVTALNHRMSGAPGLEFWGPSEDGQAVKDLIMEAGAEFGLQPIGSRIYPVTAVESGWAGSVVPAIYSGDAMRAYREWLPANGFEGSMSVGGSNKTGRIEALYQTPYELGYGFMIKFDHDFIGRRALEEMAQAPQRRKVRLVWNDSDVVNVFASTLGGGERYKFMEMPMANYTTSPQDKVLLDGRQVGVSYYPVYTVHLNSWFSLAAIESDLATDGRELTLIWGEPDGGSAKPTVERHVQKEIRVTVDARPVKRD
ncbi:aminomethyltransferase family protein [Nitratireductor sp. XY-223]|uniref:aminomethyltransferase family protein n=1 Tax=Nitratireductor sp. XY-223 TaxID=2561926 RepID=UPI0010AA3347|nr:aminomethyltransferase family protein [Nitratireductor sp. XY-223]